MDLAGESGVAAQMSAEAHTHACASCRANVEALVAPADSLTRLMASTPPERLGDCPAIEDLACWCSGDPLPSGEMSRISQHVLLCEACAFSTAQLKLELAKIPPIVHVGNPQPPSAQTTQASVAPSSPRAAVIAQILGALAVLLAAAAIILPRFEWPHSSPDTQKRSNAAATQPTPQSTNWPFEATFDFRLAGSTQTHSLMFPHHPGVHLSKDYEYSIRFVTRRAGWVLLFSNAPGQNVSLLDPADASGAQLPPPYKPGQTLRFPAAGAWQSIPASPAQYQLYAVYLADRATVAELLTQARNQSSSGPDAVALVRKLDDMVLKGGCSSTGQSCVLTFEYEAF
jgi:hypothetical protein